MHGGSARGTRVGTLLVMTLALLGVFGTAASPPLVAAQATELSQRQFDNLIESVQDADNGSNSPVPPRPPRPGSNPNPDDDDSGSDNDLPAGTRYESPTYGYSLTYDDSWSLDDQASSDGIDTLVLAHDLSSVIVYGLPPGSSAEECRDVLVSIYSDNVEASDLDASIKKVNSGVVETGNRSGSSYMFVETVIEGSTSGIRSYFECGPVGGGTDYHVGIRFSSPEPVFQDEFDALQSLVGTLAQAGAESDNAYTPDEPGTNSTTNTGANITDGEDGRLVYVSPTYGFTVEILPDWTIEENSVQNGYDTLVVASDTGRVTVSGFSSTGTAIRCVDSIIGNLNADPGMTNVEVGVQPDGSASRWDSDTTSEVVVFFTVNGTNYVRYYACFSGNDGQSMLVFAYEALEANIKAEFTNIEAMLDLIRVP